jgi:hypothetical protein
MENYQNSGGVEIMTIKLITDWLISYYETGYLSYNEIRNDRILFKIRRYFPRVNPKEAEEARERAIMYIERTTV